MAPLSPMGLPRGKGAGLVLYKQQSHYSTTAAKIGNIPTLVSATLGVLNGRRTELKLTIVDPEERCCNGQHTGASELCCCGGLGRELGHLHPPKEPDPEVGNRDEGHCSLTILVAHEIASNHKHPFPFVERSSIADNILLRSR